MSKVIICDKCNTQTKNATEVSYRIGIFRIKATMDLCPDCMKFLNPRLKISTPPNQGTSVTK